MTSLDFVDTHIHFNDFKLKPDLQWSWLEPGFVHPAIGNIDGIKAERYITHEFEGETRFCNVTKVVHVQAALGTDDPVRETAWISDLAADWQTPMVIVADARLQQDDAEGDLERQADFDLVRGVRDFGETPDYLADPNFARGYALLEKYGFLYDLDCTWETMGAAKNLAAANEAIPMVLEHAGFPRSRDDEYFESWRRAIRDLARAENVYVKISGLGMCDQRWTLDSLRPWVHECIDAFGVERSFFGTNWPVDRLFSSYPDVLNAYRELIAEFTPAEQEALFAGNAERVYKF